MYRGLLSNVGMFCLYNYDESWWCRFIINIFHFIYRQGWSVDVYSLKVIISSWCISVVYVWCYFTCPCINNGNLCMTRLFWLLLRVLIFIIYNYTKYMYFAESCCHVSVVFIQWIPLFTIFTVNLKFRC